MLTLGRGHGGAVGRGAEWVVALGLGTTGATILGVLLTIAGVLFLTGASLGAILRRSGHAVRAPTAGCATTRRPALLKRRRAERDSRAPPRARRRSTSSTTSPISSPSRAPSSSRPSRTSSRSDSEHPTEETLFAPLEPSETEYKLPDPALLHVSKPGSGPERRGGRARRRSRSSPAWRTSASTRR